MTITTEEVEKHQKTGLQVHRIMLVISSSLVVVFLIAGYFTGQFSSSQNIIQFLPIVISPFLALAGYISFKNSSHKTDPEVLRQRMEKFLPIRVPFVLGVVFIIVGETLIISLGPRNIDALFAAMLFGMISGSFLFLFIRRAIR